MSESIEIQPLAHPPNTAVEVPGSKSITNRALVIAALADGRSRLRGALFSDDTRYMVQALRDLGLTVESDEAAATLEVVGAGGRIPVSQAELFVGNSGTTVRFLAAFVALGHGVYRLDGVPRMRERPIEPLLDSLRQLGVEAISESGTGCPPVLVRTTGLQGGRCRMRGDWSSQFFSALLLAAPVTPHGLQIEVEGRLVSRPYVELTAAVMHDFGASMEHDSDPLLSVPGQQRYHPRDYSIEPDASSASYFFAAAALTGGHVRVEGLGQDSAQGDYQFLEVLERMGCRVERGVAATDVWGPEHLTGVDEDMHDISDMAQTLAVLAPFAQGATTIRNIANTRLKETDRIAAMAIELRRLGQQVEEFSDGLRITPAPMVPAAIATYEDHRMAMAFALIGLRCRGIRIQDPGCVAKTFPDYFARLEQLRTAGNSSPTAPDISASR
jgi:3-phosphoshikimate 1-carboxyvinyltransferase